MVEAKPTKTKKMSEDIKITDFVFKPIGYGHYKVTYQSPKTGKQWTDATNDMNLIDLTHGSPHPMRKDLMKLKNVCKNK
jgi:hypothetical protein